ncbi:MAG TPA: ABC transporter ATP-binding protein [Nitrospirota bacterium]|nr:ABC transporter ATP-binding protein [Nitrospirota bacterium]
MSLASEPGILELDRACYSYDRKRPFIHDLSFSIGAGEFIGLLGANGSGKSTIMKLASGILRPSSGSILLWGKTLADVSNRDRAKLISYLPQTLDISVPFAVRELVSMGLYPYDIPPAMTVREALDMVGLTEKADSRLTDLSGGERRRTFIAMTLLQGAGLILLDEPLANLDIKYQIELIRLLKELRAVKNISVVMALHDINIALQFEKVILIKDGTIIGSGRPDEILSRSMLNQAFDVDIEVKRSGSSGIYISFENNF